MPSSLHSRERIKCTGFVIDAWQQFHHAEPNVLTAFKEIVLSFLLWGSSHVLMESRYEETVLLDTLTEAAKQVIAFIDVQNLSVG